MGREMDKASAAVCVGRCVWDSVCVLLGGNREFEETDGWNLVNEKYGRERMTRHTTHQQRVMHRFRGS